MLDPLWFLGVYAVLTALTPLAVALVRRFGVLAAAFPLVVVAAADAVRFDLGGPSWAGWVNVVAGWMVPYLLGIAWARGAFPGRRGPALMLAGGAAATAALVLWAGYPASMVGVNGAAISNLNPPTLAVVTFGIAQVGLALLLREPLARWMRRPLAWAAVATVNLSAMTLFLWHQTAFLAVTTAGLARRPAAGPAHGPGQRHVGRRAARLAPGVRRRARASCGWCSGAPNVRHGGPPPGADRRRGARRQATTGCGRSAVPAVPGPWHAPQAPGLPASAPGRRGPPGRGSSAR